MAGTSLLALIDDIATILDDVAVMTKVAAKKTAGVLGDDLALNAQQVTGVKADRELPVVWAVAKGSVLNKLILVPAALAISAFAPWAITPLLMLGGAFLCYEGFEKLAHKFLHRRRRTRRTTASSSRPSPTRRWTWSQLEKDKIKGAVRTDFILSAEIIVITLGTVAAATFGKQVAVLVGHRHRDDGRRLRPGRRDREARRRGPLARVARESGASKALGPRHPRLRALAHEGALRLRHRRHVPRGRRHPRARHSRHRGLHPRPGRVGGIRPRHRRAAGGATPLVANAAVGIAAGAIALAVVTPFMRKN